MVGSRNIGGTEYFQLTNKSQEKCACIDFMYKTRNKMRVATESGKGMKVKVVKLC